MSRSVTGIVLFVALLFVAPVLTAAGISASDAQRTDLYVEQGKAQFELSEYEWAADLMRDALALDPYRVDARALLAEALLRLALANEFEVMKTRYYREALIEAEKLLELQPSSIDALYLLGRAAMGVGKYPEAAVALESVLRERPDHCRARINLARLHAGLERWDRADTLVRDAPDCMTAIPEGNELREHLLERGAREDVDLEFYDLPRHYWRIPQGLDSRSDPD